MWISVKEELPRKTERVLVYGLFGSHAVIPAVYEHDGTWRVYGRGARVEDVTHWMPLPDPPPSNVTCKTCSHWGSQEKRGYAWCDVHNIHTGSTCSCSNYSDYPTDEHACQSCAYWDTHGRTDGNGWCSVDPDRHIYGPTGQCKEWYEKVKPCVEERNCGNCLYWKIDPVSSHCSSCEARAQVDQPDGKMYRTVFRFSCGWWEPKVGERCTRRLTKKDVRDAVLDVIKDIGTYLSE